MLNNKTPLVSVGMLVYNEDKYITKSIESILQQDYKNLELIITDNCSQDNTQKICLQYAKKDDRVRYYRCRCNIGTLRTFNFTFELVRGNYFMLAGGHDLWDKSLVSRCVEILNSDDKVVLCYTLGNVIDAEDQFASYIRGVDTRNLTAEERMMLVLEQKTNLAICGLMRTEVINKVMPAKYDNLPGCDIIILLELSTWGTFAYVDEPLLSMRQVRKEISEEETITRVLKMQNPFREPHNLKTYTMDTIELFLQIVERLNIDKQQKSDLMKDVINTIKHKYGHRILTEGEAFALQIIDKFSKIKEIDLPVTVEINLAYKYIHLALLFHPKSTTLQKAWSLLINLSYQYVTKN